MARAKALSLPAAVADEIAAASTRSERSVGFLVLGALKAAGTLSGDPPGGTRKDLDLTTDEDDPRDLGARLSKVAAQKAKGRTLDEAVALAWTAARPQILAWVERIAAVDEGTQAEDLDAGLRDAANERTPPARLLELARSPYPRVRALVAEHRAAPAEALQLLGTDRERIVREALARR